MISSKKVLQSIIDFIVLLKREGDVYLEYLDRESNVLIDHFITSTGSSSLDWDRPSEMIHQY